MEATRGYSPGVHQSLRDIKAVLESGASSDEPMVQLQNVVTERNYPPMGAQMAQPSRVFGDGYAAERIVAHVLGESR